MMIIELITILRFCFQNLKDTLDKNQNSINLENLLDKTKKTIMDMNINKFIK